MPTINARCPPAEPPVATIRLRSTWYLRAFCRSQAAAVNASVTAAGAVWRSGFGDGDVGRRTRLDRQQADRKRLRTYSGSDVIRMEGLAWRIRGPRTER